MMMNDNITHIVSIGGGTSSTLELPVKVIEKYGKENVVLAIAALKGESPDLWKMIFECEQITGLKVQKISYSPNNKRGYTVNSSPNTWYDIWDVFEKVKMLGDSRFDPCSRILKRETMYNWIRDNYPPEKTILHVGITYEEIDRTVAIVKNWKEKGYVVEADLADKPLIGTSGQRAINLIGWQPELYKLGFTHNNCNGMCVKAGLKHFARLLWYRPYIYFYHAERELIFLEEFGKTHTILRHRQTETVNGVKKVVSYPMTLYSFALKMYKKWEKNKKTPFIDLEDTRPCSFCDSMA